MSRSNLLIVRAGDESLHPRWLAGGDRNWDLIVSYYGDRDDPRGVEPSDVEIVKQKGPKWPILGDFVTREMDRLAGYEYVGFPDDDLDCDAASWNLLFDICKEYKVDLAQPALSRDSEDWTWQITLQVPGSKVRFTRFVEVMAPIFSLSALKKCYPTFMESLAGWGLDFVWPLLLRGSTFGIIDGATIRHTRPCQGTAFCKKESVLKNSLYDGMNSEEATQTDLALRSKYGWKKGKGTTRKILGGWKLDGKRIKRYEITSKEEWQK